MSDLPSKKQIPLDAIVVIGGWLLVCFIEILAIVTLNDGGFTYTLDDPYIHLAVAEQIAVGKYGINLEEFSSPSSSAIWPFLLAPLARLSIGEYLPLVLNLLFGALTAWVILLRARKVLPGSQSGRIVLTWAVILCCNVTGIVFTGMEHSLQVLAAIVVVDGMIRIADGERLSRWFWVAVIAGPLVRYENLALTAAACGLLLFSGKPKAAIISGAAALLGLAAFSGFLLSLGLPAIPSSVVAKSHLTGSSGPLSKVIHSLNTSIAGNRGVLLLIFTAVLAGWAWARGITSHSRAKAALFIASAGLLHAAFGTYGWYHRYECYIYAALLYALLSMVPSTLPGLAEKWRPAFAGAVLLLAIPVAYPYLRAIAFLPMASNDIYSQQEQMHRFATGWWQRPVAVHDLGWVSYKNDAYVLDLWGLGSQKALEARLSDKDPSWRIKMARERGIGLVMVYERVIPGSALGWIKVGELHVKGPLTSPITPVVAFYATSPEFAPEIAGLLHDFRRTLPDRASVILRGEPTPPTAADPR
ncbi:hypothetical protein OKA04_06890 [Luteolibacter flavescens]|uniref:Glycosyltransferase RgtA/B/C/D-like domain-containing protein n=1 Tax=Luteolibacter flavescens TaxID=1859460 RepID=A0ABT3FMG6_9BACT|nr:hypothetical protein [Luteolibacter flavescens]MCW1884451.1 hypothetical protein [Luteolibacter flavescens]